MSSVPSGVLGSLRILRVAQKIYPEFTGGGPYHVHALSRDQAEAGHDVTVLTVGEKSESECRAGYRVVRCPPVASPLGNDIAPRVMRELWQKGSESDIIHAHSHLYASTNFSAVYRKIRHTPLVITNHGLYSQTAPDAVFEKYLHTIGRLTFNAADRVLCYTKQERDNLKALGIKAPISIVPNGIDISRFTPDPGREQDGSTLTVLFVGRLVEGKRPGDVIDAVARIDSNNVNIEVRIVGDGPLRAELHQRAKEVGIVNNVEFTGQVPYDQMPEVYRSATVLALPSRTEGFPRVLLESLACETPVVTSDLPQLESLVNDAGYMVPVGNVDRLSEALRRILENQQKRSEFGKNGRSIVCDNYDWTHTVRRTSKVMESIVD